MLFLSKLLPVFVYPLGAAIGLGLIALLLSFTRFRKLGRGLLAAVLAGLWVAATPVFSNWLGWQLESQYPAGPIEALPEVDAIILLGGAMAQPLSPGVPPQLADPADRIIEAFRLYRAGKAPRILVTGGNLPWQADVAPEAGLIADLLAELGLPRADIVLETASRNTRENAVNSAAILAENNWRSGLLVTSAFHLPRAMAAFAKAGVTVTAAPADFRARHPFHGSVLDFLPDAAALSLTTLSVKEWLGLLAYRARGWA